MLAEHADKATKLSAAVKILNQDYLAMIKGWIAGAQVNPLQGFIQGFNAITSIFTGGNTALKNYVTRFGEIESQYNKTKTAGTNMAIDLSKELARWSEENDKLLGTQDPLTKAQASFNE